MQIDVLCRPHEKKRPRNLSKLNDPSTWEKRRLKGKLAVQRMVVNLMELYLQRMRQRRPPYPKPAAMDQFAAEFPYEPTLDQNQVCSESNVAVLPFRKCCSCSFFLLFEKRVLLFFY